MFISIEGTIKKQAKQILAKNNWVKSIVGSLCVLSTVAIGVIIFNGATLFLSEDILSKPIDLAIMVFVAVVALVAYLLLSPVYTGYVRFIDKCKSSKTGDIEDVFYYFNKDKYIHTVQLNLMLALFYGVMFVVCFAPAIVMLVISSIGVGNEVVLQICALWLGIFGGLAFFFLSRFLNMATYLYVAGFNYRKEMELIKASVNIVKRNLARNINLYLSFLLWLIPCFFVLPIIFIYPYFKQSIVLSQFYVYDMENNNPSSPYFQSNVKINTQQDLFSTDNTAVNPNVNSVSQ